LNSEDKAVVQVRNIMMSKMLQMLRFFIWLSDSSNAVLEVNVK